jgi:hypothetical protein
MTKSTGLTRKDLERIAAILQKIGKSKGLVRVAGLGVFDCDPHRYAKPVQFDSADPIITVKGQKE